MKYFAIIVAGGSGQRMKSKLPKQFLELDGRPILMHTLEKFFYAKASISLILVLPKSHHNTWSDLCKSHKFQLPHMICAGGLTRFQSVKNGLNFCENNSIIAVHDGVRPLVSSTFITNIYREAELKKALIPVIPVVEALRKVSGIDSEGVDRSLYFTAQTPQCFCSSILIQSYQQKEVSTFTDDASVVEACGEKIHLLEGEINNIKITSPKDLLLAEAIISQS